MPGFLFCGGPAARSTTGRFPDLLEYLSAGDLLVLNETRVFPARLYGRRADTGGKLEVVLLHEQQPGDWEALVQPGRRALPGVSILFGDGSLQADVVERTAAGGRLLRFTPGDPGFSGSRSTPWGRRPCLPISSAARSRRTASATRPCTPGLPDRWPRRPPGCTSRRRCSTGSGTAASRPPSCCSTSVWAPSVRSGPRMWRRTRCTEEFYGLGDAERALINETRRRGGRIVAVGTTAVRVLESARRRRERVAAGEGWTRLFIYPGYRFQGHRRAGDQLSPAALHAADAGVRLCRAGHGAARLSGGGRQEVPLFQLRRCHADHLSTAPWCCAGYQAQEVPRRF